MDEPRRARPSDHPDWSLVFWPEIWNRLGLAPDAIPGVQFLPDRTGWARVHRSHLAVIGWEREAPVGQVKWGREILRPHQVEGVRFITGRRGTLLFDEMRVGKSAQVIYSHDPEKGYLIIVGPVSTRLAWHEWAARRWGWCQDTACSVCKRVADLGNMTISKRPSFLALEHMEYKPLLVRQVDPYVIFMTFAVARPWSDLFSAVPIGTFAVDEMHRAGMGHRKNVTVEAIRKLAIPAATVIGSTGTPFGGKPKNLWPMLDIVCPGAFGKYWDFAIRYCASRPGEHGWSDTGSSHEDELKLRLREVMLRRCWTDIAPNLPPVTRSMELVGLTEDQRNAIEEAAAKIRYTAQARHTVVGDMSRLRQLFAAIKTGPGIEAAKQTVASGHSCIVWTWHRSAAIAIAQALAVDGITVIGPAHGQLAGLERERMVAEAFTSARKAPMVFVATMAAAGEGLNLSFASHEVFVELDWNPLNVSQAEMRPYNGERPVSSVMLVADCPADLDMATALVAKLERTQALGLKAGVGDTKELLKAAFKMEEEQSLDELAEKLITAMLMED